MLLFSSCGTIWGGHLTKCQSEKLEGERRKISPLVLAGDIIFFPMISLPVDFGTGAIYRPCNYTKSVTHHFGL